jgi:outer membrane protein
MRTGRILTALIACGSILQQSVAQQAPFGVEQPKAPAIIRPYFSAEAAPARLKNSNRLRDLIRAGRIYLTVQDAIALVIENNLNLEVDRYGPLLADWAVKRQQAGGPLRGVPSGSSQIGSVASGQGVSGSITSAGLSAGGGGGGNGGGGNTVIQQVGPVVVNLDPVLQNSTVFSHTTYPQANSVVSQTTSLVQSTHLYNTSLQQGLITGGAVQVTMRESYLNENAPTDILNPSVAPRLYFYFQHNLLQSFGTKVNTRFIRVAKNNVLAAQETFRSRLLDLVVNVLNLYWDLVTSQETLKARQRALNIAQKFYENTRSQIQAGTVARFELARAEAEVAFRRQDFLIAQASSKQQENFLKEALSRNGTEDPLIEAAEIVTLDRIEVPEKDDLPPLRTLLARAMAKRPDVAVSKIRDANADISAVGTENALLPTMQVFAQTWNSGLSGTAHPVNGVGPTPSIIGGLGNGLAQVFRRDYGNNRAGVFLQIPFGNRVAQGDYGIDQLQLRQSEMRGRRDLNQMVVDISNQMVALQQARTRHSTAVETRKLQEELLDKEQKIFSFGNSTINTVITAQRSLVAAESVEIAALSAFSHARVALDQVLGETLEVNHVSLDEGLAGRVARGSKVSEPPPSPK